MVNNLIIFITGIVLVAAIASIFVFKNKKKNYHNVAEILREFLNYTQKEQVEGLIVLEQADSLENFKRTGEKYYARVTPLGLAKIFGKDSELKDGATVIEGNEITAINAVLAGYGGYYLNQKQRIAAAITRFTDALAIEFSRGEIWVFMSGQKTKITPERLVAMLTFSGDKKQIHIN